MVGVYVSPCSLALVFFAVNGYASMVFLPFYKEDPLLGLPICFPAGGSTFLRSLIVKEKNFLLNEQILSCMS